MRRLGFWAVATALAMTSVNCANAPGSANSMSAPLAPSDSHKGGKGNDPSTYTFNLVMVNDVNNDGPSYGDTISFDVQTSATTDPQVSLSCYQNGVIVLSAGWPSTPNILLASGAWDGGAASCTAVLYYFDGKKEPVLGQLDFNAGA